MYFYVFCSINIVQKFLTNAIILFWIDLFLYENWNCTALVVGSDDVASSYNIGVLTRRQVGRREGSRGACEVASYEVGVLRSPAYQNRRSPG